jgi:uncharacterized protein (DUF305 family)
MLQVRNLRFPLQGAPAMNAGRHLAAATLLLAATLFGAFACAQQQEQPKPQSAAMADHGNSASMAVHKAMMQGQSMAMPTSGDVDKDFAIMMTAHHRQAIAMIDVYLQHGDDTELKALAQRMKDAQHNEITEMAPKTK